MSESPLGQVAVSKAGRDQGRAFLIVGVADEAHVFLCDGVLRKLDRPKKKKLKHLRIEPVCAEQIREKLNEGSRIFDAEIRKQLITLGYNLDRQEVGGIDCQSKT